MVGIGTAVFTGYALWLGATESEVAYFVSIAYFTSLAQIVSSVFVTRIKNKRAFIFTIGFVEILLRSSLVLIPLFLDSGRIFTLGVLLAMGLTCGQLISPIFSEWLSTTIPADIRGRFTGRQMIAQLATGIIASYVVGWYLDLFSESERYTGFLTVFISAIILGAGGYLNLMRVPFSRTVDTSSIGNLFEPFHNRRFRNLLFYFMSWNFALGLANPFYSVFMIQNLGISYTTVAILNSLFMAAMVVGNRVWGALVDRFGSKPILQVLVLPVALVPVLWTFNSPENYTFIPIAMIVNGLFQGGVWVSVNPLLYSTLPEGRSRTSYFATWSCSFQLAFAIAPVIGGVLAQMLAPVSFELMGFQVGNLQIIFLISAGCMVMPGFFLRKVSDSKGTTPRQLFTQVGKGNLLGYLYSSFSYDRTDSASTRAIAARRMGRSKSPMALERLILALEDASPEVRRQAAQGLGEARAPEAVSHLVDELADEESDIRSEAAEALGKIGDQRVLDPLINALNDPDNRVQISAIRALSEMGGEEANELLFWKFADGFDRTTFPTLSDVLGRARDLRMVRPTLKWIDNFRSPAIRLQLLNSVCRALGARRRFYRLVYQDDLARADQMAEMIRRTQRVFKRSRILEPDTHARILQDLAEIRRAFDSGESDSLSNTVVTLAENLQTQVGERAVTALGGDAASRIGAAILAIRIFSKRDQKDDPPGAGDIFPVVCLWCLGDAFDSVC
jgi:MFS family permease